jgi:hypothetical protein
MLQNFLGTKQYSSWSKLLASAYLPNLSAIQLCFSLTTNQQTILSAMAYHFINQANRATCEKFLIL